MKPRWDYGDAVRLIRNVRNDGTFPGMDPGELLIRRGSIGHVINVGTFLQDQIIYSVHFLGENGRMVGCREEELIGADEPWVPSRYEVREKVQSAKALAIRGEVKVPLGSRGEILNLDRSETGVIYHVHFDCLPGTPLGVPESAICSLTPATESSAEASAND